MQTTVTESAPAKNRNAENYGKPKIAMDDLKCCDCAYCGRELVGPSHREYAHHFGMKVAKMIHDRPYCPTCSQTATSRTFICMTCKKKTPCLGVEFQNGIPYCLPCANPAEEPWRNVLAIDRNKNSAVVKHDHPNTTNVERLADAAVA